MKQKRVGSTILEILSLFILIAMIVFFIRIYDKLPEKLLFHMDETSKPLFDGKLYFLGVFWLAFLCYGGLFLLKRFPHFMIYSVKITPENMLTEMNIAKNMLAVVTFLVMLIFGIAFYTLYYKTIYPGKAVMLFVYIVIALFLALIAVVTAYYLRPMRKRKKENQID